MVGVVSGPRMLMRCGNGEKCARNGGIRGGAGGVDRDNRCHSTCCFRGVMVLLVFV